MDDVGDPLMGRSQDPRGEHPAGRGIFRMFKTGEPTPPSVGYYPDFGTWLEYGMILGFCSEVRCDVHDGLPISEDEYRLLDEGDDICIAAVRIYPIGRAIECSD